ncbi:hypothetical protein PMAYCL1PPCAC_23401 [Pristionchus mayeri]|uniref:Uncharacterized protein n=1 Tax=Pristionchus mayeri TaxID=1317129 RepID=A0AAN5I7G4_9BILA|nr:hypothetical protein PMAYCL1PPCAC_23401 [Pristionchus mayeri]
MGSPSPLYGNMDTIRAAAQQQAQQQQSMHVQQRRQIQLQQQQAPPNYGCPPPHPIPEGFPIATTFAPPPGMAPPHSFPSTSFAPPPFSIGGTTANGGGGQEEEVLGANGPPTLEVEREREGEGGEEYDYDDEDDELSTQVTRSGSMENIDDDGLSHDISGFQSNVETANNSCRLSPISYSDLPDSPTQCAALRDNTVQLSLPSFPIPSSTLVPTMPFGTGPHSSSDGSSGGLSSSHTHSSHTTPHATSAEQTPTYSSLNAHYTYDSPRFGALRIAAEDSAPSTSHEVEERSEDDDDDYGVYEEDILDRSIQEALLQREEKRDHLNSFLLGSISSALPPDRSPSKSSRYSNTSTLKEDDLLAAAIESAMPKIGSLSSPRGTLMQLPKNGVARWSTTTTTEGQKMSERGERGEGRKEEEESEESDEEGGPMGGSLVGTMPRDVEEEMEAERIAIDCSSLKRKPRPPRTSLLPRQMATPTSTRTTRQATPTSNGRPSPRPSSIGRPRPLTSTPASSKSRLSKFPSTPRVSAVTLSGTPNGNSHPEATPPPTTNGRATPTSTSSASLQATSSSTSSTMSRLKKPTASAVVPPYNYQIPKSSPRFEKEGKEGEKSANGQMLVTTV